MSLDEGGEAPCGGRGEPLDCPDFLIEYAPAPRGSIERSYPRLEQPFAPCAYDEHASLLHAGQRDAPTARRKLVAGAVPPPV